MAHSLARWRVACLLVVTLCLHYVRGSIQRDSITEQCTTVYNIDVYETQFDSPVADIQWIGSDTTTLFALTAWGTVYRSTDGGKSWQNQTAKLQYVEEIQDPQGSYGVRAIVQTPSGNCIYLLGWGSLIWTTKDRGETYQVIDTALAGISNAYLLALQTHPTQTDWALASASMSGCWDHNTSTPCYHALYASTTSGVHWQLIDTYVTQFVVDSIGNCLYLAYSSKHGNQQNLQATGHTDLYRFTFPSEKPKVLLHGATQLSVKGSAVFVEQLVQPSARVVILQYLLGDSNKFTKAALPMPLVADKYTILASSDEAIFLQVPPEDGDDEGNLGTAGVDSGDNLLVADVHDGSFVLVRTGLGTKRVSHWATVSSSDGVYLANFVDQWTPIGPDSSDLERLQTYITFDNGGKWRRLQPPDVDASGQPLQCGYDCGLHLHLATPDTMRAFGAVESTVLAGPLLAHKNAVGLVVATGNVGPCLEYHIDELRTYISQDGGWSWSEVRNSSHTYYIGNYGGFIAMANNVAATSTLVYSIDEGTTWQECVFVDSAMEVDAVVGEPSGTSQSFLVVGTRLAAIYVDGGDSGYDSNGGEYDYGGGMNSVGVLVYVDMAPVFDRVCTSADYTDWSPSDSVDGNGCILGQHIVYTRRTPNALCANPIGGNTPLGAASRHAVSTCPCSYEDYSCDFCFAPAAGDDVSQGSDGIGSCTRVCDASPVPCEGEYDVSMGYRRVPGDMCNATEGINLLPVRTHCANGSNSGHTKPLYSRTWFIAVLVVCTLIVVIGLGAFAMWRVKNVQNACRALPGRVQQVWLRIAQKGGRDTFHGDTANALLLSRAEDDQDELAFDHTTETAHAASKSGLLGGFNPRTATNGVSGAQAYVLEDEEFSPL